MKITVAIPTIAGREKYLTACLMTCVSQDCEELEILVSDNSVNQSARNVVKQFQDKRIKYVNPSIYLPMSRHWDFVISQISGDIFTIIGDDDGLMPNCINRVQDILKQNGLEIIHHSLCNYFWPDYLEDSLKNKIIFFHSGEKKVSIESGNETFRKFCKGQARYVDGPMVYHNFIPTNIVRTLIKDGVFFRRASPDVYSSVALSAACTSYISIGEFLTISGQSAKSNGIAVRIGEKESLAFISEMQANFKPRFNSKSIQLALLDCIYEVVDTYQREEMLVEIDFANHLYRAVIETRSIAGFESKIHEIVEIVHTAYQKRIFIALSSIVLKKVFARLGIADKNKLNQLSYSLPPAIVCDKSVNDIYQASVFLDSHLKKHGSAAQCL
ncbi:glycosyltransferase family 2 protein [bacterium]|nr:glycosyltransferase family 2 protein [bacterium]